MMPSPVTDVSEEDFIATWDLQGEVHKEKASRVVKVQVSENRRLPIGRSARAGPSCLPGKQGVASDDHHEPRVPTPLMLASCPPSTPGAASKIPDYEEALYFDGARPGMEFRPKGPKGSGYYRTGTVSGERDHGGVYTLTNQKHLGFPTWVYTAPRRWA